MTCDDYLAMLETLPVEELTHGEAREHAAICHDCNRVTRVVAERERNMLMAYGDVMPAAVPTDVALSAIATARRRRLALVYKIGLGVAALLTVGFIGTSRAMHRGRVSFVRERFAMHCLGNNRAERILRANVPDLVDARIRRYDREGFLEVDASPMAMEAVRAVLDEYNEHCMIAVPAMPAVAPLPAMAPAPAVPAIPPN